MVFVENTEISAKLVFEFANVNTERGTTRRMNKCEMGPARGIRGERQNRPLKRYPRLFRSRRDAAVFTIGKYFLIKCFIGRAWSFNDNVSYC